MPILPPIPATGYDTANTVLTMVSARLGDEIKTLLPVSGNVSNKGIYFTQQTFNTAWRKCQSFLAEKGYARLVEEVVIQSLPVVASLDPAVQVRLSWDGYFDGANYFQQPALPQGFDHPIKIWERWSGQNAQFGLMTKCLDGLPSEAKTSANRFWEWRNDSIYMPGSQMIEDLRIRFALFLPDIIDVGTVPWFQQTVPIVRIADGLSWFICAELAGSNQRPDFEKIYADKGEAALVRVFNLDVKADQRVNIRRIARSGRGMGRSWY